MSDSVASKARFPTKIFFTLTSFRRATENRGRIEKGRLRTELMRRCQNNWAILLYHGTGSHGVEIAKRADSSSRSREGYILSLLIQGNLLNGMNNQHRIVCRVPLTGTNA